MKKKLLTFIGFISVVILGLFIFRVLHPTPVWEKNAEQFSSSMQSIHSKTATIKYLSDFTTFEWNTTNEHLKSHQFLASVLLPRNQLPDL